MRFTQTNWNFYRAFILAYETGSINKAAEILGSKRENTSKSIKALEHSLGVKLFTATTRGVTPTTAGAELYQKIEPLFSQVVFFERDLYEFNGNTSAIIRLAMPSTFSNYHFRNYVIEFYKKYPNIKLQYFRKDSLELLENKRIDFIVRADSFLDKHKFTVQNLFTENLIFIASKKYLTQKGVGISITKKNLFELDTIGQSDLLNVLHSKTGLDLSPRISTATHEQVYPLVKGGLGVGLCFNSTFDEKNNDDVIKLQINDFEFKEKVSIAYNNGLLTNASKAFVHGLIEFCKDPRNLVCSIMNSQTSSTDFNN